MTGRLGKRAASGGKTSRHKPSFKERYTPAERRRATTLQRMAGLSEAARAHPAYRRALALAGCLVRRLHAAYDRWRKPLPLPVWDRQRGTLLEEWMDDHQPLRERAAAFLYAMGLERGLSRSGWGRATGRDAGPDWLKFKNPEPQ